MLKQLRIKNVILVEEASILFNQGFNILTGETGSGKSAIMHGLSLAIGDRTDTSIIRKGCDKGIVEAVFDLDHLDLSVLFEEGGIDHERGQELVIRRELSVSGKSRIFINNQLAQLSFLKKIGQFLAQIVGQHANQSLYSIDYHRSIIDLFGHLNPLANQFKSCFQEENAIKEKLEVLIKQEAQRLREIDICLSELEELEEARVKEGEDEELFAEYTFLINAEELAEKIGEINTALSGDRQPIVPTLHRQKQLLDSLVKFDPSLSDTAEAFKNVLTEIQEISHTLRNYQSRLHYDANRLQVVNERLTLLNRLKRKYGSSVEELLAYQVRTRKKLDLLENADQEIESLKEQLIEAEKKTHQCAQELTEKRKSAANQFANELTAQLHALNMGKAQFLVDVEGQKRTSDGDDRIEFFLLPNVGENRIALKDGASGGELSRVLLALQTLLAGKERVSALIFDEVDANIGGETASIIGEKLREISQQHQVICITHFPQVASCAHYHLQISKEEREGRTVTLVTELDVVSKKKELARMSGRKEQG